MPSNSASSRPPCNWHVKPGSGRPPGLHVPLTVDRFEHCNFKAEEVLVSFGLLLPATGAPLSAADIATVVPPESQTQFKALAQEQGLK